MLKSEFPELKLYSLCSFSLSLVWKDRDNIAFMELKAVIFFPHCSCHQQEQQQQQQHYGYC